MSKPEWVTVAVLGRARGIRGEITAVSTTSHPDRFALLKRVYLFGPGNPYSVERVWDHQGLLIFKFQGVDSMTDAEALRGYEVRVPGTERVELEEGEYFHSDLIGCEVRDAGSSRVIGKVTDFEEFGGPGLLQIDGGRFSIPFVRDICVGIHPEQGFILVRLPEGLEDVNTL